MTKSMIEHCKRGGKEVTETQARKMLEGVAERNRRS